MRRTKHPFNFSTFSRPIFGADTVAIIPFFLRVVAPSVTFSLSTSSVKFMLYKLYAPSGQSA